MSYNPYTSPPGFADSRDFRPRSGLKAIVFGSIATVSGLASVYCLAAAMYWHWESTRQLPVAEVEAASYDYHAWLFLCIIFAVVCLAFSVLLVVTLSRRMTATGK
jgi:hypothetical protein